VVVVAEMKKRTSTTRREDMEEAIAD
jgi:hypothetical protein